LYFWMICRSNNLTKSAHYWMRSWSGDERKDQD
jgi:hypothetical protein